MKRSVLLVGALLVATACSTTEPAAPTSAPATTATPAESTPSPTGTPTAQAPDDPFTPSTTPAGTTVCSRFTTISATGTVADAELLETSGIAASRRYPGVLWAHNDSGSDAAVHAVATDGTSLGMWKLDTAALDWEDMAIGPGPDPNRDYLYLGDIGDNLAFRPNILILRIPEPEPESTGTVTEFERIHLVYPTPGIDAEALAVDPVTGDVLVISKVNTGAAVVYRARGEVVRNGAEIPLEPIAQLALGDGTSVTAADISADGTVVVFRGYEEVWMWARLDIELASAFAPFPCDAPSPEEIQGEAIALDATGSRFYTISEGAGPTIFEVSGS